MYDFKGQTVIVTGGTRGIGKSIAESFLHAGASMIVTYTSNEVAAAQFERLSSSPPKSDTGSGQSSFPSAGRL